MKEKLIQYVELLFAGAPNTIEIKQEILQNTLDRYDDLIAQGKSPEAAYRLAISGIGDINEILNDYTPFPGQEAPVRNPSSSEKDTPKKQLMRAIAIALYILCPVPVIIFGEYNSGILGVSLMFAFIAAATVLIILGKNPQDDQEEREEHRREQQSENRDPLRKSIGNVIWALGLAAYFIVSFTAGAWHITWIIFPITASIQGLANAIADLKEACKNET